MPEATSVDAMPYWYVTDNPEVWKLRPGDHVQYLDEVYQCTSKNKDCASALALKTPDQLSQFKK